MHAPHRETSMKILALLAALFLAIPSADYAQSTAGPVVTGYQDANGRFVQYGSGSGGVASNVTPGSMNVVALDIDSVTTGTTAVVALNAGHAVHGGFLITSNSAGICVDSSGDAGAGTATAGNTICVNPNVPYYIPPTTNAISVNSTASSVTFAGNGLD